MKIKPYIKWLTINSVFAYSLYEGVINNNQNWQNVFLFMFWVSFALSALSLSDKCVKAVQETRKENGRVYYPVDVAFDIAVMLTVVYHGWWVVGFFYFLHIILVAGFDREVKEIH